MEAVALKGLVALIEVEFRLHHFFALPVLDAVLRDDGPGRVGPRSCRRTGPRFLKLKGESFFPLHRVLTRALKKGLTTLCSSNTCHAPFLEGHASPADLWAGTGSDMALVCPRMVGVVDGGHRDT